MAIRNVRIGSLKNFHSYDDTIYLSAIDADGRPIKAGVPVDVDDVVRLGDLSSTILGPASSTDNAIARFDGTTGKVLQNSTVTIDDVGNVYIPTGRGYNVNNIQVISDQQAVEPNASSITSLSLGAGADTVDLATFNIALGTLVTELNNTISTLNNLLTKLRTHGLIDT